MISYVVVETFKQRLLFKRALLYRLLSVELGGT